MTTTTKIFIPDANQYDTLDLSGRLFSMVLLPSAGIFVGGLPSTGAGKISGVDMDLLAVQRKLFDLVLIEGDGAARKALKGWNATEPVVPEFTDKTIGIVDIQTIGCIICEAPGPSAGAFCRLTGGKIGERVTTDHLYRVVVHANGLFFQAQGEQILYINKVESPRSWPC